MISRQRWRPALNLPEIPGYRIENDIGHGGMATAYLATQLGFERKVVVKIMLPSLAADEAFAQRFLREARLVGSLNHANVITVHEVGEQNGLYFLSMEYVSGGSLRERIEAGMTMGTALRITRQLTDALGCAHARGILHRDIKPDNILFRDNGQLVLTDFGIARDMNDDGNLTVARTALGSPRYMSPEQALGHALDGRSDLFSVGIVLYEMLAGSAPWSGKTIAEIALEQHQKPLPPLPGSSRELEPLLNRLLAIDPDARFQDTTELAAAIDQLLDGSAAGAPAATAQPRARAAVDDSATTQVVSLDKPEATSNNSRSIAGFVAVLVVITALALFLIFGTGESNNTAETPMTDARPAATATPEAQPDAPASAPSDQLPALPPLTLATNEPPDGLKPGDAVSLQLTAGAAGYLFCYFSDAEGIVLRFFPNRFSGSGNQLEPGQTFELPGGQGFEISTDEQGRSEHIDCFLTADDVTPRLPWALQKPDFEELDISAIGSLVNAFNALDPAPIGNASLTIGQQDSGD